MSDFFGILAVALLPAAGNIAGTAVAELAKTPRWVIGAALHAAAGVAVALVSIDLMPRVLETTPAWLLVALFGAGAAFSVLMAQAVKTLRRFVAGGSAGAWMVYMATAVDLLSDGLMTGVSSAVSAELGLLLALSQVVANIPGGFATIANFHAQGVKRSVRLIAAGSLILPVMIGAGVGYYLLRGTGAGVQNAALAVIVGVLLVTTMEDLVPEADKPGASRAVSTSSLVGGFGFFALLASYLG